MSVSKSSSITTNPEYLFVKIKGQENKSKSAKKILIPGSLEHLCKAIQNAFGMNDQVRSLYTIDDEFIREISQLVPRSTIIASNEAPNGIDFRYNMNSKNTSTRHFDPSAKLQFTEFPKPKKTVLNEPAPKYLVVGFPDPLTMDQSNLRYRCNRNLANRTRPKLAKSKASQSSNQESNTPLFMKTESDHNSNLIPSQNFHFFDQVSYTTFSSDASLSTTAIEPQRIESKKQKIVKKRMHTIKTLFENAIATDSKKSGENTDNNVFKQAKSAISKMKQSHQNFILTAEDKEYEQKQYWISQVFAMISTFIQNKNMNNLFLDSEIRNCARKSIFHHRFLSGNFALHHFNVGIIGPSKSGKSTLLEIYTQEVVYELSACDDWKSTFLFILTISNSEIELDNYQSYYVKLINQIFDQIGIQKPTFHPIIPIMKKYFESLISNPIRLNLSKSVNMNNNLSMIQTKLEEIGTLIGKSWSYKSGSELWFTLIFILPSLISKALSFSQVIYIIDNIEEFDLILTPHSPFNHSTTMIFVSEHLKSALNLNGYIFSCRNMQKMYKMLTPIDDDGIDLATCTDFLPVNGLFLDSDESDSPLLISLSGMDLPFVLKASDCDGIPKYILLWKDLNRCIDEMNSFEENTDEFYNLHYSAVIQAQVMLILMFFDDKLNYEDGDEYFPQVLAVRKATTKEQIKFQHEENQKALLLQRKIDHLLSHESTEEEEEEEDSR